MLRSLVSKSIFLSAFAGLILFSCSEEPQIIEKPKERIFKGYHISIDSIIKTPDGILRGWELGAPSAEIKASEYCKPEESDADYILYSCKIDSISDFNIAYSLSHDTLDGMEVNIKSKNIDESTIILNDLKKFYTEKYTAPLMDKGIYVFNCFDSRKLNFKISIEDVSTETTGIINMMVYREEK